MLKEILARLADGRSWTIETLAQELGVTPELLMAMIDQLVRQGYLKPVGDACGGGCTSCSLAQGCIKGIGSKLWTLAT
jgi:hypothetical protein